MYLLVIMNVMVVCRQNPFLTISFQNMEIKLSMGFAFMMFIRQCHPWQLKPQPYKENIGRCMKKYFPIIIKQIQQLLLNTQRNWV